MCEVLDRAVVLQFGTIFPNPRFWGTITEKCSRQKNVRIHSIPVVIHKEEVTKAEKNIKAFSHFNAFVLQ